MTIQGWAEIALTIGLAVGLGWPLGIYMARVWEGKPTWLDPVLGPTERLYNGLMGVKAGQGQGWLAYSLSFRAFSAASFLFLYVILRLQDHLPLNPQGFAGMSPELAFNTAISFLTNTDWQFYSGESAASHFSQMAGFTVQNFASAAAGIAVAAAMARAFAANRGESLGNFWTDLFRPRACWRMWTPTRSRAPSSPSRLDPSPARKRSSNSAQTAGASSTPTRRTPSKIPARSAT
jgi:K+-transporting ATPase ATPase A chain